MRELLEKLGLFGDEEFDADRAEFRRKLAAIVAKRPALAEDIAFRITVDMYHPKAAAIVERVIGSNDLYVSEEDKSLVVLFPLLRRREARIKAARLRNTIDSELLDARVHLNEVYLEHDGTVKTAPCPELDVLIAELISESESSAERQSASESTSFAEEALPHRDLVGVEFIHRPMLTLQTKIVSTFLVVPVRRSTPERFESGYDVLFNPRDSLEILELDQLTLRHTVSELNELMAAGGRSLFGVPVHFETLANPRRAREYVRLGIEKLTGLEKRIVFEIVGLPSKIPQARLVELVSVVASSSRAVIARFPSDTVDFQDYRSAGLHAVGIDIYGSPKRERALLLDMARFAEMARKSRLKSYIQGVRTVSMLTSAISAGFDYVAGHALGAPCLHAEDIRTFQFGDIYGAATPVVERLPELSAA